MHAMSIEIERSLFNYINELGQPSKGLYKSTKTKADVSHNHLNANEFDCITCHGSKGSKKKQCKLICNGK
jgi:cytochrome c